MTKTANRSFATLFAVVVAAALWLPTLTVPNAQPHFVAAPASVELA